jgi:hypothetical protein
MHNKTSPRKSPLNYQDFLTAENINTSLSTTHLKHFLNGSRLHCPCWICFRRRNRSFHMLPNVFSLGLPICLLSSVNLESTTQHRSSPKKSRINLQNKRTIQALDLSQLIPNIFIEGIYKICTHR